MEDFQEQVDNFAADFENIRTQISSVIVGQENVIDDVLTCLICGGHVLLEGLPGLGKTKLVRTLSKTLELAFSRIQFTPDLMPADITGSEIITRNETNEPVFTFHRGPVFANLILADEINRATPKTQAALLQAMQEHTVSIVNTTHTLSEPFMVLATQNPIEMEGTYPLPEAQLDRFMLKVIVKMPNISQMSEILDRTTGDNFPNVDKSADPQRILQMRHIAQSVKAADDIKRYIAKLVISTHPGQVGANKLAGKYIQYGASPRAGQAILKGAQVRALCCGRANVSLGDVKAVATAAMRHRIILNFQANGESITTDELISNLL